MTWIDMLTDSEDKKTILAVLSQLVIIWFGNKGSFVVFLLFYQLSVEWFPMQEKGGAGINDAAGWSDED